MEVSRNTSFDAGRWVLSNFTKDIDAASDQFLSHIIRRLVVDVRIVVHLAEYGRYGVQLARCKSLGGLDAEGNLKHVDNLFKRLRIRIAFHQLPEILELVAYVRQGIAPTNEVPFAVPRPLDIVKTRFETPPAFLAPPYP